MPKLKLEMGAEPKKIAILLGLFAVAGYLYFSSSSGAPEEAKNSRPNPPAAPSKLTKALSRPGADAEAAIAGPGRTGSGTARPQRKDFRPSLVAKKGEERDPARIDPTIRLDLLAKVASIQIQTAGRSLFDFGPETAAPVKPSLPEPKIVVKKEPRMHGPEPKPPPPPPPVKPPPPPINLKFYGANLPQRDGAKRVFCIQGEEILTPSEGETIQRRYKIVKINPNSVLVEDVEFKHQQLIPIDEPPKG